MKKLSFLLTLAILIFLSCSSDIAKVRYVSSFNSNWKFLLGDTTNAYEIAYNDSQWRSLDLPHDWSIEGSFSEKNPATAGGGALPGGIGWYRKSFVLDVVDKDKLIYAEFDGVYRNSEVWINGHYLGLRPYGYSSFRYELTPFLKFGNEKNIIAVKVDNSKQPNSRWYSGSGIYRNVWLVKTGKVAIDHWGTYVTATDIKPESAKVNVKTKVANKYNIDNPVVVRTIIYNAHNKKIAETSIQSIIPKDSNDVVNQDILIKKPVFWNTENPYLYKVISLIEVNGNVVDDYETPVGIRYFNFDSEKGFSLNGKQLKIRGVCDHHDLGCLGSAVNTRALERQLQMLKEMGVNGIRTSHNPPAPELLDLCDKMGFIVMDEAFDMWQKKKSEFDYALDFPKWHKRDLEDMVLRDRNHPCVFIWSIGNEILEQWDTSGLHLTKELAQIVKNLDSTRPITSNLNAPNPSNYLIKSGALDLIGFSYNSGSFADFLKTFPAKKFIGSETNSSLQTRGYYEMPSDSVRLWPVRWDIPFTGGNPEFACSSYDNCRAPWGTLHETNWKLIKKYDFLSGMFMWTGFDYIGEPTPYSWPARSSYFGVIDLAGFPKDAYYFYQSEWTDKPVLHIFPHWNWKENDTIDVWAYTNIDEVELFLNGKSLGAKKKTEEIMHLQWKVAFQQGVLVAVGKRKGEEIKREVIKTAGEPFCLALQADRNLIKPDGSDLSFITVKVLDKNGNVVPNTDNLIKFEVKGTGFIAGVDNGDPTSHFLAF
jgi:beta-galactosidase